jgi:cell division protein FtsB
MEWLLYLLCPLMMVVCMIGLFKSGKKESSANQVKSGTDLNDLKGKMESLLEQNKLLTQEVKGLQSGHSPNHLDQKKRSS